MSASTASSPSAARVPSLPPPRGGEGAGLLLRGILPSPSAGDDPASKDDGWQRTVAGLARGSPRKAAADALHRFSRKAPTLAKARRRSGGFRRAAEGQCEQLV